jgi:hypothetical protein
MSQLTHEQQDHDCRTFVYAEGLAMGAESEQSAIASAYKQIEAALAA